MEGLEVGRVFALEGGEGAGIKQQEAGAAAGPVLSPGPAGYSAARSVSTPTSGGLLHSSNLSYYFRSLLVLLLTLYK